MVGVGVDVAVFVFDEVDEGFGATDVAEFCAIDDFVLAVGFFIFAAFEPFVGFFDDEAGGFLHEHGFDGGGEGVGVADAEGGVVFVEEEELDGNVVFDFVDLVGPVEDVEGIFGAVIFAVVHIVVIGAGGVGGVGALGEVAEMIIVSIGRGRIVCGLIGLCGLIDVCSLASVCVLIGFCGGRRVLIDWIVGIIHIYLLVLFYYSINLRFIM